ncbi:hypothetical protein Acr_07g0014560 [Actinidia rufa]|uniref:CCHC-type domain-containing protein n=1 Tax=Actinidia rufa TaxID=165716 RepID=A0A7J0EXV7_9ERIC|nr:hypothetical protein Acr_07g0014560 [Actinidia rufa]
MEDILFCKDLHDPLENKGKKPIAKKDEEWRKINRKTIGLIRQCIGHEVFHHVAQETSAYVLWIKLEEMYQAKTSQNKALLMRRLVNLKLQRETTVAEHTSEFQNLVNQLTNVDLQFDDEMQALLLLSSLPESWETLVVSLSNSAPNGKLTTSMVMDALFNEEARRREMGSTDQSESQALVSEGSKERGRGQGRGHHRGTGKGRWRSQARGRIVRCFYCYQEGHIKRDCPKYKTQVQSSNTAATAVMAVDEDESDIQRDAALTLVEEVSEFPRETRRCCGEKKTKGLYRLEGNVQTGGAIVRHESSGISKKNGQGKQPLHRGTQSKRRGTWRIRNGTWKIRSGTRAQGDALGYVQKSGQTRVMQLVQDVHREVQRNETKLILRSCTAKGTATPKRVSFALDLISGGVLSSCAHKGGEMESRQLAKCIHFGGKWSSPLMRLRYLGCCLAVLWGSWIRSCQEGQLEDIGLPSKWSNGYPEQLSKVAEQNGRVPDQIGRVAEQDGRVPNQIDRHPTEDSDCKMIQALDNYLDCKTIPTLNRRLGSQDDPSTRQRPDCKTIQALNRRLGLQDDPIIQRKTWIAKTKSGHSTKTRIARLSRLGLQDDLSTKRKTQIARRFGHSIKTRIARRFKHTRQIPGLQNDPDTQQKTQIARQSEHSTEVPDCKTIGALDKDPIARRSGRIGLQDYPGTRQSLTIARQSKNSTKTRIARLSGHSTETRIARRSKYSMEDSDCKTIRTHSIKARIATLFGHSTDTRIARRSEH